MDNIKNDIYYINKIKQDLEFIVKHMKNINIEDLNIVFETLKNDIPNLLEVIV